MSHKLALYGHRNLSLSLSVGNEVTTSRRYTIFVGITPKNDKLKKNIKFSDI